MVDMSKLTDPRHLYSVALNGLMGAYTKHERIFKEAYLAIVACNSLEMLGQIMDLFAFRIVFYSILGSHHRVCEICSMFCSFQQFRTYDSICFPLSPYTDALSYLASLCHSPNKVSQIFFPISCFFSVRLLLFRLPLFLPLLPFFLPPLILLGLSPFPLSPCILSRPHPSSLIFHLPPSLTPAYFTQHNKPRILIQPSRNNPMTPFSPDG